MAAERSITIREERLLLVEGKDDFNFFRLYCEHLGISTVQVVPYGGKGNFSNFISTLRELSDFEEVRRLGIVRDANGNADGARQSVEDALRSAGLWSSGHGTAAVGDELRASIMILPPGGSEGCLETLLWNTIRNQPNASCVEKYLSCVDVSLEGNRYAKAKVHAYLAAQKTPGLKIGESVKSNYWNLDDGAFDAVHDFLRELAY